jgi:transposase
VMGIKERRFGPLPHEISLEDLVPEDSFYRRLEAALDLSFVRDLVRPLYAKGGRPSVDPVVFFRLQIVLFFEGLRSERELMRVAADRLSVRWYLGYDLHEPLPDHSNLTRTRERFGLPVFRRFFERIVELCAEAGLVWGEEMYFDATKVDANASLDSIAPRFAVEEHLGGLFEREPPGDQDDQRPDRHRPAEGEPQGRRGVRPIGGQDGVEDGREGEKRRARDEGEDALVAHKAIILRSRGRAGRRVRELLSPTADLPRRRVLVVGAGRMRLHAPLGLKTKRRKKRKLTAEALTVEKALAALPTTHGERSV